MFTYVSFGREILREKENKNIVFLNLSKLINISVGYQTLFSRKMCDNKDEEPDNPLAHGSEDPTVESIRNFFAQKLGLNIGSEQDETPGVLESVDMKGIVKHWNSGGFKKIVTMVGAGISTSAGIPDFRSPETGLYNNLKKYNLPHPHAIFEIDYFVRKPQPFFALAKELYPGKFKPTPSHYFIRLLHEKSLLHRHYTQNVDTLERIAGIPDNKLVEAHGTFHSNHCLGCRMEYSMEWMKKKIFDDIIPTCSKCNSLVKPDIVFFGENLPEKFYQLPEIDFKECDLLIIMGTSLEVQPFASLVERVNKKCVRLLINREVVGCDSSLSRKMKSYFFGEGLQFDATDNKRDIAWLGDCDDGVWHLATELGLKDELQELIDREHKQFDEINAKESADIKCTAAPDLLNEDIAKDSCSGKKDESVSEKAKI